MKVESLQYIQKKDGRDVEMDDVLHNLGQYFSEFNQHIRNYLSVVSKESQDVVESTVFISELANLFFKNDIKPCTGLGTFLINHMKQWSCIWSMKKHIYNRLVDGKAY